MKKSKSKEARIKELHQLIDKSVLEEKKLQRYKVLIDKLERRIMTESENKEFMILIDEEELIRNERVSYMIELSHLRQVPFQEILDEFSFQSEAYE